MSKVDQLIEILNRSKDRQEKPIKQRRKRSKEEIRHQLSQQPRIEWKGNSVAERKQEFHRLRNRHLDNWSIYRMPLSKRSYSKNQKSIKIPTVGRQFNNFTAHDKEGHLPFLYQSDVPKIQKIRSSISGTNFGLINTEKNAYFGLARIANSQHYESADRRLKTRNLE